MDIAKCTFCGKEFKKKPYLNRHLKEVHKTNSKGKPLSASVEEKVQCALCDKKFSRKFSLQDHINVVHLKKSADTFKCPTCKYSFQKKSNLNRHILKCRTNCEFEKNFKCSKCSANFMSKYSLKRHEQKNHKIMNQKSLMIKRKCPLCSFDTSDPRKNIMYIHFENAHHISLEWENYSFGSLAEFYDWKRHVEKITVSSFFISHKSERGSTFQCRRSGVFKPEGKNMRRLKTAGSCKINGFCPCSIKIKLTSDCVTALYQPIHVGHKNELKHVRLSKEERRALASMLAMKVPHKEILNIIRGSSTNSDLQRIHLINKKDLANIERDFNLNRQATLHPYDPVSIESWVLNPNKSKDTLLDDNDFFLTVIDPQHVPEIVLNETSQDDNNEELEGKKQVLFTELAKLKMLFEGNCTTEQVEFMLKTIKQSVITVEAMKSAGTIQTSDSPEEPGNTKRRFFAPLKTKRKTDIISKEEIQNISLDSPMEKPDMSLHSKKNPLEPGIPKKYSDHTYFKPIPAGEENREQYNQPVKYEMQPFHCC